QHAPHAAMMNEDLAEERSAPASDVAELSDLAEGIRLRDARRVEECQPHHRVRERLAFLGMTVEPFPYGRAVHAIERVLARTKRLGEVGPRVHVRLRSEVDGEGARAVDIAAHEGAGDAVVHEATVGAPLEDADRHRRT